MYYDDYDGMMRDDLGAMMMAALSHDLKKMGIDNVKPEVEIKEENSGKKVRCPCHAAA